MSEPDNSSNRNGQTLVFTGGGTAGHVIPGLAVADAFKKKSAAVVVWIGSRGGMEESLVRARGLEFYGISCGKLRRYLSLKNIADMIKTGIGFLQARRLLKKIRPALVFSKGGFVSVPVVAAAGSLKIPGFTHESDMDPGLATRINARFVRNIFVSTEETVQYFSPEYRKKIVVTGNPVRRELLSGSAAEGRKLLRFPEKTSPDNRPVLLILGGSQGSRQINDLVFEALPELAARCFVVHQTGPSETRNAAHANYRSFSYLGPELADVMAAADIVLSRAGANVLWELAVLGKPSILIPLDLTGSRGDQIKNARYFADLGASIVLSGQEVTTKHLFATLDRLLGNGEYLAAMSRAAAGACVKDAADVIARILKENLTPS